MTTIDTTSAAGATTPAPATDGSTRNALGQDAFMKLLITQLEHQDPTAPKDDTQLIAQLAQFSSLERLTSMDQSLKQLAGLFSGVLATPAAPASASQTTLQEGKA